MGSHLFGAEHISTREHAALFCCFKSMLETSEAGYVFYGKKPLCLIGCSSPDLIFQPKEFHRLSVSLSEAKDILQNPLFRSGDVIFHFDIKGGFFLVINKSRFLQVIEENKMLFQYVLGPSITPEQILQAILSPDSSFLEFFKYDRVLIGIVLGYGLENALYASRMENIMFDLMHVEDLPPFVPYTFLYSNERSNDLLFYENNFLTLWKKERHYLCPSYGYSSLEEELSDIERKMKVSSSKLQQMPRLIFGCLKDSKENAACLKELEEIQEKIKTLLLSEHLLEDTLKLIFREKLVIDENKINQINEIVDIHLALAKLLKLSLKEYSPYYHCCFIEGLKGQLSDCEISKETLTYPEALTYLKKARTNVEEANLYFQKIQYNPAYQPIYQPYLYRSIIKKGSGASIQGPVEILVDYEIFDPRGCCLAKAVYQRLNLQNVLPSFSHGVQGMQLGEVQELFIHPSLAYGVHTLLEKGIYLKAVVTLHDICKLNEEKLPPLEPKDLSYLLGPNYYGECEKKYKRALQFMGQQRRNFLLKCSGINLDLIAETVPHATGPLSSEEIAAINHLFWTVYFPEADCL